MSDEGKIVRGCEHGHRVLCKERRWRSPVVDKVYSVTKTEGVVIFLLPGVVLIRVAHWCSICSNKGAENVLLGA